MAEAIPRDIEGAEVGRGTTAQRLRDDLMVVNMGPQHPSTHGVLRLLLTLDGENVVDLKPIVGYLHTGIEKNTEYRTWQQGVTFVTRADYLSPFFNELAYCLSVERLLGIEAPPRAQAIRVLVCELNRIASHLVWLGTTGLELGAISMMLYGFRERERLLDIFELVSGLRMNHAYIRIGGLVMDLPEGAEDQIRAYLQVLDSLPGGPVMIEDPKLRWPARLSVGPDGIGNDEAYVRHIMEDSMEALINHFKLVTQGIRVPAGEVYTPVESPRGELGYYVVSDGGIRPYRVRM